MLTVRAKGFAAYVREGIEVNGGEVREIDVSLAIEQEKQQVTVSGEATSVNVNPASNASTLTLQQRDLDALADDPDEMQADLEALAGPSAGPNGGQFYVDGFTVENQIPPKSSIREIRTNQNPFSTKYDKLGYGRIEIFTKPGTGELHGQLTLDGNDLPFDARNPFAANEDSYYSALISGNASGPINKRSSFAVDFQHRNLDLDEVVNAVVLDSSFNQIPFYQTVANPGSRTVLRPRVDYQLTPNNTFAARYELWLQNDSGDGVGQFSLPTQAYNLGSAQHIFEFTDTQVINAKIVNETMFQFIHEHTPKRHPVSSPKSTFWEPSLAAVAMQERLPITTTMMRSTTTHRWTSALIL